MIMMVQLMIIYAAVSGFIVWVLIEPFERFLTRAAYRSSGAVAKKSYSGIMAGIVVFWTILLITIAGVAIAMTRMGFAITFSWSGWF